VLTSAYMDPTIGTLERRSNMMDVCFFTCFCPRCKDPTELGSNFSTLKCPCGGNLLATNPLNPNSQWYCVHNGAPKEVASIYDRRLGCGREECATEVISLLQRVKSEIQLATGIQQLEELVAIYKDKVLHRNHYLVMSMQYKLVECIDKVLKRGTYGFEETIRLARRQVELSRNCLAVAHIVLPGSNRFRGKSENLRLTRLIFVHFQCQLA